MAKEDSTSSSLLAAVDADSVETVRDLVPTTSAADLSAALCRSCERGRHAIAEVLLESEHCDPNLSDEWITPLFLASRNADPALVKILLQHGADVNTKSNMKRSRERQADSIPLHALASYKKNPERDDNQSRCEQVVELLLNSGCDINSQDNSGATLLLLCVIKNAELIPFLLRHGADPNLMDDIGRRPLQFFHTPQENPDLFRLFMAHGARLDLAGKDGIAPLHTFASKMELGDLSLFKPYVSDWNITTAKGNTVLHIAVKNYRRGSPTVAALLDAGLDPSQRNHEGQQAIHKISDIGDIVLDEILDILCNAGSEIETKDSRGRTLLATSVCGPNRAIEPAQDLIPHLISRGADINSQDYKGNNLLSHLIEPHKFYSAEFDVLLQLGADPQMQNYAGDDFLHQLLANYATLGSDEAFLTILSLLKNGHPPARPNFQGRTPLHAFCGQTSDHLFAAAAEKGKCAIDLLLDAGLDTSLNTPDHQGIRPIHLAATTSEILVGKLIDRGADATTTTKDNRNLLHIAATARQSNIVGLLLDHYTTIGMLSLVNMQSDDGKTPLHLACRSGRVETVNLLLACGADTRIRDKRKHTPIDACSEYLAESQLWVQADDQENLFNTLSAAGVMGDDKKRPHEVVSRSNKKQHDPKRIGWKGEITSEDSSLGIAQIVRALASNGGLIEDSSGLGVSPMFLATSAGDEELAVELVRVSEEMGVKIESYRSLETDRLLLRSRHLPAMLKGKFTSPVEMDNSMLGLVLKGHHRELAEALEENAISVRDGRAFPGFLLACARWGFTELFERIGKIMPNSEWINGGHRRFDGPLIPYLLAAAQRDLPNLEVIKVIVEKFHADINIPFKTDMVSLPKVYYQSSMAAARGYRAGDTILHHLAQGTHWWYEGAIRYLLQHGADPNARNAQGKTPLCVAVSRSELGGHRQWEIVNLLLEGGADPNLPATCGFTPLAMSAHDQGIFELLIQHGARPSEDHPMELFQALCSFDEGIVQSLLDLGLDVNNTTLSSAQPHWHAHRIRNGPATKTQIVRPIHYISTFPFNESNSRDHAIRMINFLLAHGADPFLPCDTNKLILHEIFASAGIIQPWLDMADLDLERRDPQGRTLLLCAARCQSGAFSHTCTVPVFPFRRGQVIPNRWTEGDPTRAMALYKKGADLTAIDNSGNTVFHHMAGCEPSNKFAEAEFRKTARLFLEKVPELAVKPNENGKTPLDIAKSRGVEWAMELFGVNAESEST